MQKTLTTLVLLMVISMTAQETKKVFGKVSDGNNPIKNVIISIIDNDEITYTDAEGAYEISASEGDKLQFSYAGLKTITIKIEDVTRILNPIMVPDVTELDEVVVEASKRRSQQDMEEDYVINKDIIRTAFGYLDADRAAGNIRIINETEINSISLCILDLLRSRFGGVRVYGDCNQGGSVLIRGASSITNPIPAVYDVDGQIFTDAPIWLSAQSFKRIAVLGNLASTTQYGSIGAGGVIVINTINGNPSLSKIVDRARLRNNYATAKVLTKAEVFNNMPEYQQELEASTSFEAAQEVFNSYNNSYSSSPYFYIDAARYFQEKWNETAFADELIESNFKPFLENAVLLKALAYIYEEQGRFDKANKMYKEAFIKRPEYAQSYFDMANSYSSINQPRQAATIYARYEHLIEEGFIQADTTIFGPIMSRSYNNLLMLEKNAVVESRKVNKLYIAEEDFDGSRLVFEWNDSEAEFELQFVNPSDQYFTWKHSLADNADLIEREKEFGFNVSEYLVDGSLPGTWKVNVNYLGNKSLTPSYLKATVYYNFGEKSQRKEVKVYKLSLKNINHELFKINNGSRVYK